MVVVVSRTADVGVVGVVDLVEGVACVVDDVELVERPEIMDRVLGVVERRAAVVGVADRFVVVVAGVVDEEICLPNVVTPLEELSFRESLSGALLFDVPPSVMLVLG